MSARAGAGEYVLALDQGTTSSRAILFDRRGRVAGVAQREFPQHFPRSGWVEHDAEELWSSQLRVMGEVLEGAGLGAGDVAALGITNQRETTLVWDRVSGAPIHRAIVWQDRRTAEACERLEEQGAGELVAQKTGLVIDPYFSGTKLAWILDHVEGARARAERGRLAFGTVDSWLVWKLTEGREHLTDVSNAARTMLYDIHAGRWDEELLELFDVPAALLPEVRSCSEVFGHVAEGLPAAGVPVAGLIGDQQAATMGQVCLEPGLAKNTYGTGCFLLMNTGGEARASSHRLLTTVAWEREGERTYALEGGVFVGGAIVQWLRDGLGLIETAPDVEALAETVEDSGGVVLVPALAGLGAPHWDPRARGAILGLSRGTTAGHLARAALEGVAFQVADLAEAMEADAGTPLAELRVDGGAAANDLLMQLQADLLQRPVERPTVLETTALGAAYMAGLAVGHWGSTDELIAQREVDRRFEPSMSADEAAARRARWADAVQRAMNWEREG